MPWVNIAVGGGDARSTRKTLFHSHTHWPELESRGMFPSHPGKPGVTLKRHTERLSPARRGRRSDDGGDGLTETNLNNIGVSREVIIPRCFQ